MYFLNDLKGINILGDNILLPYIGGITMGSISEYFQIKKEIQDLKEEVNKKIKDSNESTKSRSESIQYINKKIISKKKRLKNAENRIITNYIFPLFVVILILAYYYIRQNFL
ncbi:hypothetical protein MmarC5_0787 [Methanococcus maripaludis C5]|uniref:Uncharacterized protein n=2 Tax=Methanococcus maripaludis TaxID=39152 RepID=A4FY13_METM5|nr:hypothetical protein MmarC5_0787 [Methanococcus maripaludis C5]